MIFQVNEEYTKKINSTLFRLHEHDFYEIYVFEKGNASYAVEGADYPLEEGDLIFIRPGEMHRVHHRAETEYLRTVIHFDDSFFKSYGCEHYKEIFWKRACGEKNKIGAKTAKAAGISDVLDTLRESLKGYDEAYAKSLVIQILYLACKNDCFSTENTGKKRVKDIVSYINEHYPEKLTLEEISDKFFITKYHLTRIFREATGHTVNEYITLKRIRHVEELSEEAGLTLGEAALKSGYKDYSSFYRAYLRANGKPPKKEIKRRADN